MRNPIYDLVTGGNYCTVAKLQNWKDYTEFLKDKKCPEYIFHHKNVRDIQESIF